MKDAESGQERWIDTSDRNIQQSFKQFWKQHDERMKKSFLSTKVDRINIETHKPYLRPLVDFFKMREARV
jgi:hypothetical protein